MRRISSRYRGRWQRRRAARSAIGRKRAQARWAQWVPSPPDADTLMRRALDDARGQQLREGHTYTAAGVVYWQIVRSRHGRTDQLDILLNGHLWRTCGPRRVAALLRRPINVGASSAAGSTPGELPVRPVRVDVAAESDAHADQFAAPADLALGSDHRAQG